MPASGAPPIAVTEPPIFTADLKRLYRGFVYAVGVATTDVAPLS